MGRLAVLAAWATACALFSFAALAVTIDVELERLGYDIGEDEVIHFQFGQGQSLPAIDEFGRACTIRTGRLMPFERDGETFWRLEQAPTNDAPHCNAGMVFKIRNNKFVRHDHGFAQIFKFYAIQSCDTYPASGDGSLLPLREDEAQFLTDCFLKRNHWASAHVTSTMCIRFFRDSEKRSLACTSGFRKLIDAAVFLDVVVIKEGNHFLSGAGGNASRYILAPDFKGQIQLRGHGQVFYLPGHHCASPDIFNGCTLAGRPTLP